MKKPINEIAKMQRIAGLITENEYQEALQNEDMTSSSIDPSKLQAVINRFKSFSKVRQFSPEDRADFALVASNFENNELAQAAKNIQLSDQMELMYEKLDELYPELWEMLYDINPGDPIALSKPKTDLQELNPDQMAGIAGAATGAAGILAAATAALKQEYNKIIKNNPEISKTDAIKQALMNAGKSLTSQFGSLSEN
jgi:hypothetical protein